MNTRRDLLRAALTGAAAFATRLPAQTPEARIDVLLGETGAAIAPEIYGHFVEDLGGVVYDGIWVGENSGVANVGGIRKALVDALRKVKPGPIRWPGGCFADQYDWRDGTGPRDKRPKRTNFWADAREWGAQARRDGPQVFNPNQLGTVEFARFSELAGAQPYLAANVRSLPAQEFWRWVEYCNSPADKTTLGAQRAADGHPTPMGVRYWGVGNESWGCGGNFTPEDYATEFRRYTAWVPQYGVKLAFVGSGPGSGELAWTEKFFDKVGRGGGLQGMWGWALHHYAWNASGGKTTDWMAGKSDALQFDAGQYYSIVQEADRMESLIQSHWSAMSDADPRHQVKLVVDEWGTWYAPGTEPFHEALLGEQSTMRDAVVAGLTLDTFNRHADKVAMANVAQLVNCLQSLFLAHENRFCVTPTYHVFDLYSAHQGGTSVRAVFSAPEAARKLRGLNGSASVDGKRLTLTATNPSMDRPCEAEIAVRGGAIASAKAWTLAASDPHAHNTFEEPRAVEPKPAEVAAPGGRIVFRFPPASVTKFEITLG
jgi:alpha-N-arabinofuranosidase